MNIRYCRSSKISSNWHGLKRFIGIILIQQALPSKKLAFDKARDTSLSTMIGSMVRQMTSIRLLFLGETCTVIDAVETALLP